MFITDISLLEQLDQVKITPSPHSISLCHHFFCQFLVSLDFTVLSRNTEPTSQVSGTIIFNDAQSAQTAINGIYRMMFGSTFVSGNYDQAYGQSGAIITQDVMGEDMVLNTANWFTFDYQLIYSKMYNNRSSRPYFYWNYFYTLISNVNYITAEDGKIRFCIEFIATGSKKSSDTYDAE